MTPETKTPTRAEALEDAIDFLERLSKQSNWSSGYPCAPIICNDMTHKNGCFTAKIHKDAARHAKTLKGIKKCQPKKK